MHSFLILEIVLLMALVKSAPVADSTSSDGITPDLEDQLDSGLNFQPLPKIVTILSPAKADPEPITVTKSGSIPQDNTTKPVGSTADSELNPHSGNATSPELAQVKPGDPNPTRGYFQENDFKCPKEASFIGCCDGGDFHKCETCNDSLFLHVLPEFCPLILQN
ncbi:hypothetical protein MMC22_001842 [Lobaria immixta]|nr:hypothetical protein [Lobaria immixta]